MNFIQLAETHKVSHISGRYITLESIEPLLQQFNTENQLQIIGESVLKQPIYSYKIGHGKTKILMWSQMHGNESTTTKALFDLLHFLHSDAEIAKQWLTDFTFLMLPMLNPDGAKTYIRENANAVDLNRDAQDLSQPESKLLRASFDKFQPNYCFNLHDQRTIYAVGDSNKPATVSFLAPAFNAARDMNVIREKAIAVIVAMNAVLQNYIPNQVGRFDDAFNLNCVGDTFQSLNVPTILFEAGHFQNDYQREETRKFIFIALISGLLHINENVVVDNEIDNYLNIPQNKAVFFDIVYKNVKINYDGIEKNTNFAVHYKEELIDNQLQFNGYFAAIGNLELAFGHFVYDAQGAVYSDERDGIPKLDEKADFWLDKIIKIDNGRIIS
jgi:hypothetical protein